MMITQNATIQSETFFQQTRQRYIYQYLRVIGCKPNRFVSKLRREVGQIPFRFQPWSIRRWYLLLFQLENQKRTNDDKRHGNPLNANVTVSYI